MRYVILLAVHRYRNRNYFPDEGIDVLTRYFLEALGLDGNTVGIHQARRENCGGYTRYILRNHLLPCGFGPFLVDSLSGERTFQILMRNIHTLYSNCRHICTIYFAKALQAVTRVYLLASATKTYDDGSTFIAWKDSLYAVRMSRRPKTQHGVHHRSVRERTCRSIQHLITNGTLAAGSNISVRSLAKEFGSSRTPIRETMNQLAYAAGKITCIPILIGDVDR